MERLPTRNAHSAPIPCQITFKKPSLTKQSFAEECDINNIMAQYQRTGMIDHINTYKGDYGDATGIQDYQTSLNQILAAQDAFQSLPSKIRSRFGNDPGAFLEYTEDADNLKELLQSLKEPTGATIPPATPGGRDPGSATPPPDKPPEATHVADQPLPAA